MKLLLLLAMIHLLIFHQLRKDKNEMLLSKRNEKTKVTEPVYKQDDLIPGIEIIEINYSDSLLFPWQPESLRYNYVNPSSLPK